MNPRAINVEYHSPFKLLVTFTNGEMKVFDLLPYLNFPVYQPLKNEQFCSKAKVQYGTIVWNEEIDIDPDRLFLESKELSREKV